MRFLNERAYPFSDAAWYATGKRVPRARFNGRETVLASQFIFSFPYRRHLEVYFAPHSFP